jgi:hypothetical protein
MVIRCTRLIGKVVHGEAIVPVCLMKGRQCKMTYRG